jgi:1-acyl-sn-glycerol-3-phosphate acyltransferase
MGETKNVIDVERAIKNGNSRFLRSLPKFIIRLIIKIVKQDEFNNVINNNSDKIGVPFINGVLNDWNVKVETQDGENIPQKGRFIFASNHPVGGLDALSFYHVIFNYFTDIVSPANELLNTCPNIRPLVFPLNVFGKADRETALKLDELYESDTQIMIFPAGEVSRRTKGVISDLTWQKSFITKAVQHKRDIIPVFISGRNSNLFYIVANLRKRLGIKMYVETMLLPREMLKQRNSTVVIRFGKPIPYHTFTNERTYSEWAHWVKSIVYSLPETLK